MQNAEHGYVTAGSHVYRGYISANDAETGKLICRTVARYLHTFLFRCPHRGELVEVARKKRRARSRAVRRATVFPRLSFLQEIIRCPRMEGESHSVTELRD